jgi:hypothetical protein
MYADGMENSCSSLERDKILPCPPSLGDGANTITLPHQNKNLCALDIFEVCNKLSSESDNLIETHVVDD